MNAAEKVMAPKRTFSSAVLTVLCFLVLMPPFGLLTALVLETVLPDFAELPFFMPPGMGLQNPLTILLSLTALIIFYVAMAVQSLLCGLAVAAFGWLRGVPSLVLVIVVAAVTFAIANMLLWRELPDTIPTMLAVHVVPAILCWFITRRLWQEV